jgi:glucosylceramidase
MKRRVKNFQLLLTFCILSVVVWYCHGPIRINGVSSVEGRYFYNQDNISYKTYTPGDSFDVEILLTVPEQVIDGFGGCFHELGWQAMQVLDESRKDTVLKALFTASGCNFNTGRMSIGANDFALNWYSYDEKADDYEMKYFSIDRDKQNLIPFIKSALKLKPDLKIWGSPWCPPSWMKKNSYYACSPSPYNDLDPILPRRENGETDFIMDQRTMSAYALYFVKYVQAYQAEGITVNAVHVQNEPHSCQSFPSCLWQGADLKNFIRDYMGPLFAEKGLATEIWYSTFERPYAGPWIAEIDSVLNDKKVMSYIRGFGFQWAGRDAIAEIHKKLPDIKLMHTEMECGDGQNTWAWAEHVYELLCHYFNNGANAQMYWNIILNETQKSSWGWPQNSMITINSGSGQITFNPDYFVMKHFSHFIKPGAHKLKMSGKRGSDLAFVNPRGEIVMLIPNKQQQSTDVRVKLGHRLLNFTVPAQSINTFLILD